METNLRKKHTFKKGDNVNVVDYHTAIGTPYIQPCTIIAEDGDVYIMRERKFNAVPFRVGKYYPHIFVN